VKNKIFLDPKTGQIKNVVFDEGDLSKTSAELTAKLNIEKDNQMKLILEISLNDKFEIIFKEE